MSGILARSISGNDALRSLFERLKNEGHRLPPSDSSLAKGKDCHSLSWWAYDKACDDDGDRVFSASNRMPALQMGLHKYHSRSYISPALEWCIKIRISQLFARHIKLVLLRCITVVLFRVVLLPYARAFQRARCLLACAIG